MPDSTDAHGSATARVVARVPMGLTSGGGRITQARIRIVLLVLGLGGMAVAVIGLRNDIKGHALPSVQTLLFALVLGDE